MTFHATRRGAAIVGLWLVLAGALAVFLFGPGGWVSALLLAAWAAAVYGGFVPRLASAKLYVGRHHVSARWGMLFPSVRRFPRRFVTHSGDAALPPYGRVRADVLKLWRLPDSSRL